ncbi:MAG: WD40 repeat protein, partial [Pirellulaceae bacterium]
GVISGLQDWVTGLSFSPKDNLLASGCYDGSVQLWNTESQKEDAKLDGFTSSVWSVTFSPKGESLAAGSHKNSAFVWDVASRKRRLGPPPAAKAQSEESEQ